MYRYEVRSQRVKPKGFLLDEGFWRDVCHIVLTDIRRGMEGQRQLDGTPYAPLKASTIARKSQPHTIDHPGPLAIPASRSLNAIQRTTIARGLAFAGKRGTMTKSGMRRLQKQQARYISMYPSKRLLDGGNMLNTGSIEVTKLYGLITPGPERANVIYHQQEDPGSGNVATQFWGISDNASISIVKEFERRLDQWLQRI